jgi:hypothetical protein
MRNLALCALLLAGATSRAAPAPVARYDSGGSGFIDDAFTLADDGKSIAFLTTDGATVATLHLATIGGGDVKIEGAPIDAVALHWLAADRVLIVHGSDGKLLGEVFTPKGIEKIKLGPFLQLAIANVDGKRMIVTYSRNEKHGLEHEIAAYDPTTLRALKRKTLREDAEGQIHFPQGGLKPLWWSDGFTVLHALRAGEYDKARDIRRPDRYTRVSVLGGKIIDEREVSDVLGFTRVGLLRRDAPNQPVIVHYSEDRKQLLMLDGLEQHELALARPLSKYDPQSLRSQLVDDKRELISLTIDPVNPDAVSRQKADVDEIDVYAIDRPAPAATRILTLPGQGRPSSWRVAGNRIALLRKDKGFDRGGIALEIYDLPVGEHAPAH